VESDTVARDLPKLPEGILEVARFAQDGSIVHRALVASDD
jgi:hypothetical protein